MLEMVMAEMSEFLRTSKITEKPTFVHAFAKTIRFSSGQATVNCTMPTPI